MLPKPERTPSKGTKPPHLRLLADRAVGLECVDSISYETVRRVLKKRNQTVAEGWLGNPPEANAEFVAAMERVFDMYRRPYNADIPVACMDETSVRRAHRFF